MNNPFTLSFGKKPVQYISRIAQTERIIGDFTAEESPNQIYMITGVRGSGKTVMMTNIASEIRKRSDEWIVVELNPNRDLLQSLAAKIYAIPEMHAVFVKAKLDFSVFGLGVTVENESSPNLCVNSSFSYVVLSTLLLSSKDLTEWSLVYHSTLSYQRFYDLHSIHYDHLEGLHQLI